VNGLEQDKIHDKGFNMNRDYTKIKFGGKTLEDAIMDLSSLKGNVAKNCIKKEDVVDALISNNAVELRKLS
jgi:hypothetical protein